MEELPEGIFLKFKPNQLQQIREIYNLNQPGRIDEAVDILVDWLKKQDHFRRKEFPREYLERLLIGAKGSVERTKSHMDKLSTFRTLWPELFSVNNIKSFARYNDTFNSVMLPELTDDLYRVNLFKIYPNVYLGSDVVNEYIKYSIIVSEYIAKQDYANGYLIILDYRDVNLMDLLTIASPTQIRQMMNIYMDGYGMRIKGIHILTKSKMSDALVSVLKQVLSKKVGSRIHVHMDMESLHEFVPKKILPSDYDGNAPCMDELRDGLLEELSTEEHIEFMKVSHSSSTDESKRTKDKFNENYIGMPGSFRTLTVD